MGRRRLPYEVRTVTVKLPVALIARMDAFREATNAKAVDLHTEALTEYLDRKEKEGMMVVAKFMSR